MKPNKQRLLSCNKAFTLLHGHRVSMIKLCIFNCKYLIYYKKLNCRHFEIKPSSEKKVPADVTLLQTKFLPEEESLKTTQTFKGKIDFGITFS